MLALAGERMDYAPRRVTRCVIHTVSGPSSRRDLSAEAPGRTTLSPRRTTCRQGDRLGMRLVYKVPPAIQ